MGEVIVITSGKGGVGKTTSAANLGTALTMMNKKVALVDTDIGLRNLDVVMGLENRIVYDIVDVVEENCKLKQALIKDRRYEGLYLLPAAQTRDKNAVNEEQMIKNAIAGADRAFVVTTPEVSAVRDADRIVGLLQSSNLPKPQLILNRIRTKMVREGQMMDAQDIVDLLSINLIGAVPDDENVIIQTNMGEPSVTNPKSPSGKAYMETARRILGEDIPVTIPGKKEGFFSKIKGLFAGNNNKAKARV